MSAMGLLFSGCRIDPMPRRRSPFLLKDGLESTANVGFRRLGELF
jgi:hypothetical protein